MEKKIFYITKEKLRQIKKEYNQLVAFERSKTEGQEAPRIFESDNINPEFVSFQEDISSLRSRIDELKNIIDNYEIIKIPPKEKQNQVGIGAKVKVDSNGQIAEFTITGTLEANPKAGFISDESPVGKALLGHKVGDIVEIQSPMKMAYKIREIKYEVN